MRLKKVLALSAALCLSLTTLAACGGQPAAGSAGGAGKPVTLIFAHNQTSTDHSFHKGAMKFKEELEKLSGGQVMVEVHAGDLGTNESELVDKVQLGGADICVASPSFMGPKGVKEVDLLAFTYLFRDMAHWTAAIDGEYGKVLAEAVKKSTNNDYQVLANFIAGTRDIYAKKFIKSADDMKGLKIRVQNSPVCTEYWTAIGALPVSIGWGELYQGLQQGQADGAENSYVAFVLQNHHTTTNGKYITETHHDYATRPMYINGKKFDSLTAEQQGWVKEAARAAELYQREEDAKLGEELKAKAIKDGAEVYTPTAAEIQFMVDAAVKQQDEFAKKNGLENELKMIRDAK